MTAKQGILFVLDGASAARKTTLALALAKKKNLTFVPRYTTRTPRAAESDTLEYVFAPQNEFSRMAESGAFIEHRHYDFGMSYGLPWKEIRSVIAKGGNAVAIINLDRVRDLKAALPEAIAILIDVSEETIRQRLLNRKTNSAQQIAERLSNSHAIDRLRPCYDYVVKNEGNLDNTLEALSKIIDATIAESFAG
jgi:guanylate kinase